MKSTGIIRRIDELGRVVIPKEIRRALNIRNGDFLEILCEENILSLRKFSEIDNVKGVFEGLVKAVARGTGETVLVCDRERFVCAEGPLAKTYGEGLISSELAAALDDKKSAPRSVKLLADREAPACMALSPIAKNGELFGGCILLSDREEKRELLDVCCETVAVYIADLLYE